MARVLRSYTYKYLNQDKTVIEVLEVENPLFKDGIRYNFIYLRYVAQTDQHVREIGVDNSHGPPHLHRGEREYELGVSDWKQALAEFKRLVAEYRALRG